VATNGEQVASSVYSNVQTNPKKERFLYGGHCECPSGTRIAPMFILSVGRVSTSTHLHWGVHRYASRDPQDARRARSEPLLLEYSISGQACCLESLAEIRTLAALDGPAEDMADISLTLTVSGVGGRYDTAEVRNYGIPPALTPEHASYSNKVHRANTDTTDLFKRSDVIHNTRSMDI
jgi:murein DD-endopeptidase MepM/ murein hydrolase activator NlpD